MPPKRRGIGRPAARQLDLFSARPQNPPRRQVLRAKTMLVIIPQDKRFHESVLMIGDRNIGKIQYFLEEKSTLRRPNIKLQFILPSEQGKRYGTRLLAHFLLSAKAKNVHHVIADVGEDNTISQRMFERMGFSMKRVPLGGRAPEEGGARYLLRFTLDLEHMGPEGIARRLAESLRSKKRSGK